MRELDDRQFVLEFGVRRSVRYHARRRRHFDRLHRFTTFVALIFGSATFAALLGAFGQGKGENAALVFATVVTVTSALDLVIGSATRARDHHEFERRWIRLEQLIARAGDYDDAALSEFVEMRLEIEADEEPPLRVLDLLCHNELMRAEDRYDDLYRVGWAQKVLSQWVDFRADSIQRA
jgi:hypothetical protein